MAKTKDPNAEMISREEVNHVAELARLELSEEETAFFQNDLNSILSYVESLKDLDTENVSPMSHVLEVNNVWRGRPTRKPKRNGAFDRECSHA